jgi:hypothetical protein
MLITRIWKSVPGKYFCISSKDQHGKWHDEFFKKSELKEVDKYIEDNQDKDLYWCPHGLSKPRRLNQFTVPPKLMWADLDEADPRDMNGFMPTVAWESSPGRYCGIWMIDKHVTEDLNKRMSYEVGADKGGWDFTQVLRIPGTRNYKYTSTPKVRTMWTDGPTYTYEDLDRNLKPIEGAPKSSARSTKSLYKKYERNFSVFVRRELMRKVVKKGKRSEVIWRLVNEILEAGCSTEECFDLIKASNWNKFAGRRDEDKQLWREINKAADSHIAYVDDDKGKQKTFEEEPDPEDEDEGPSRFFARSMADVEEENIDWIWYPYLAHGEVTILEGDPGLGKSYLAQMVGVAVCDGLRLPSPKNERVQKGRVCYFDMENSAGTVTKKRLLNNGIVNIKEFFQEEEPFSIDDEDAMDVVYEAISRLKPKLVVFDTLNTYIGRADTHNAAETQQAFKQFVQIARRFNCSVLVLRHLNKSAKGPAIYRGQGSIAFAGLARVVMTVGKDPEEPDSRILAVTKINVAKYPRGIGFHIESLPDKLNETDRSQFVWGDFVDVTADEMLSSHEGQAQGTSKKQETMESCQRFIVDLLSGGPVEKKELMEAAQVRSFGERVVYEAAELLGVKRKFKGYGKEKRSYWSLEKGTHGDAQGDNSNN